MHAFLWYLAFVSILGSLVSISALSRTDDELKQRLLGSVKFRLENRWIGPGRLIYRIAMATACIYFATR